MTLLLFVILSVMDLYSYINDTYDNVILKGVNLSIGIWLLSIIAIFSLIFYFLSGNLIALHLYLLKTK